LVRNNRRLLKLRETKTVQMSLGKWTAHIRKRVMTIITINHMITKKQNDYKVNIIIYIIIKVR